MARFSSVGLAAVVLFVLVSACPNTSLLNVPPSTQFYYPSGLVHIDTPASPDGVLFVANGNFDKRYAAGTIMAVNLGRVGLPAFGAPVAATGPKQLTALNVDDAGVVLISSFAGEMAALDLGQGRTRLFVPSRSEGMKFHIVDADALATPLGQPALHCVTPVGDGPSDCSTNALSLSPKEFVESATGLPRAIGPFGVNATPRACLTSACPFGDCVNGRCLVTNSSGVREPLADVYVTHLTQADSPIASNTNARGYLVHVMSHEAKVTENSFINLGAGATNSVVGGKRYVYTTGRGLLPSGQLLRMVDPETIASDGGVIVFATGLETTFRALEARGLALSSDEHKVYVATRTPDALVVAAVDDPVARVPVIQIARALPLPLSPNTVRTIARPGQGDLVVITCTGAQAVIIYDEDVGDIVVQVSGVGLSPFDIAVDLKNQGARLFVSDFDDGRIAVIDIPDLNRPQDARLVAHLGDQQLCLTQGQRNPQLCDAGVGVTR